MTQAVPTDRKPLDVDDYLHVQPLKTRARLEELRRIIRDTVPDAVEGFSYGMPAYRLKGRPLAYCAGYAGHVGLYALPATHAAFAAELAAYRTGKGSVQFPLDRAIPAGLVARMLTFRAAAIEKDAQEAKPARQPRPAKGARRPPSGRPRPGSQPCSG